MNIKKQLALAWTLVGVLAVLLLIAGYFLTNPAAKDENVTVQRDLIREHCSQTDASSQEACAKDLQKLSDMLREFSVAGSINNSVKINP
jgi:transcriptional regulator of NAD metabolism